MKQKNLIIFFTGILIFLSPVISSQTVNQVPDNDKLVVLWTSDDPMVAERVALMYTHAAKTAGWFSDVTLIVWGPSAKLIAENIKLQEKLRAMQKDGVVIEACVACANAYGVVEDLKRLGYDVRGMGKPLTDYLKSGAKVLTF
ncbi:MAG: DsrE family protein [Bacteroidales bacterium]|nr:DsrE family protein [Bacteroidales bacterium]